MENNLYILPMESDKIDLVAEAFVAAGGKFVKPKKDKQGAYKGGYSSLEEILDSVKAGLEEHGLRFFQRRHRIIGEDILVSTLLHKSGQWLKSYAGLPLADQSHLEPIKRKDPNQLVGASITYQCRYEAPIFLGLADADPDNDPDKPVVVTSGSTEYKTITDKQVELIRSLLNNSPDRESKLCIYYKIKSLNQLPMSLVDDVMETLNPKE